MSGLPLTDPAGTSELHGTDVVSVVIPTYNRAQYLPEAIASVVSQGPAIGEIIVVDDGSTDDTEAVLRKLEEPRLRVLRQSNRGPAAARNHGWRASRGPWVAFLDSDDTFAPGAIEALLTAARSRPDTIPTGRATLHVFEFDRKPYSELAMTRRDGWIARDFCRLPLATIFASLFPRRALMEVDGFSEDPALHLAEDFDLGLRLTLRHPFTYVDAVCYRIRMHRENRHAAGQVAVFNAVAHSLERRLRGHSGYWALRRQFRGTLENIVGSAHEQSGDRPAARRCYARSLWSWPLKWQSVRGLARTWRAGLTSGPAASDGPNTPDVPKR